MFEDIRATRKSDFVNNFWRALANQPRLLERTCCSSVKEVMTSLGVSDPLTKELVYIAVSTANSCSYCVHSHTAARANGLSDEQYAEFGGAQGTGTAPGSFHVLINPEIELLSPPKVSFFEGCLSLPGFMAMVPRARKVRVRALNESGAPIEIEAKGWYARILQHGDRSSERDLIYRSHVEPQLRLR